MMKDNATAQAIGRLGGQAGTKAQNRARKVNAQLGGRPRRVCTTCGEPVIGGHFDRELDETCGAHGWRWQRAGDDSPVTPPTIASLKRELARHLRLAADLERRIARLS